MSVLLAGSTEERGLSQLVSWDEKAWPVFAEQVRVGLC